MHLCLAKAMLRIADEPSTTHTYMYNILIFMAAKPRFIASFPFISLVKTRHSAQFMLVPPTLYSTS